MAVGYSGLATLGGLPTDHVLAEAIHGSRIPRPTPTLQISSGHVARTKSDIVQAIIETLDDRYARLRTAHQQRLTPAVMLTGWGWELAGPTAGKGSVVVTTVSRHDHGYHAVEYPQPGGSVSLKALPKNRVTQEQADNYFDELTTDRSDDPDEERATDLLAQLVRASSDQAAAAEDRTIGKDVMTISIPRPDRSQTVTVRFRPDPDDPAGTDFGNFVPWAIHPGGFVSPSEMTPNAEMRFGRFSVRFLGPGGTRFGFRSYPRR